MRVVPIEPVPNQELTLNLDGVRWTLRLKVAQASMAADVLRNDDPVVLGQRIAVGTPILPYAYMQGDGNFIFLTDSEQLPDWQQFGRTQQLLYVSSVQYKAPDELKFVPWEYDFYSYADAHAALLDGQLINDQLISVRYDETRGNSASVYRVYIAPDITLSLDFVNQVYGVSSKDDALILV